VLPLSLTLGELPARIPVIQPGTDGIMNQEWIQNLGLYERQFRLLRPTPITVDAAPTLTFKDAGNICHVATYNHLIQWTGEAWGWAPGDLGSGYYQTFAAAPTGDGWAVCDGSTTTILTIGVALGTQSVVTPNTANLYLRR